MEQFIIIGSIMLIIWINNTLSEDVPKEAVAQIQPIKNIRQEDLQKTKEIKVVKEELHKEAPIKQIIEPILADSDGDGVFDDKDRCSHSKKEFAVDKYGCLKTPVFIANFEYIKYDLSNETKIELKKFTKFLKENQEYKIIIYGHTDGTGKNHANISQNRADSVKKALIHYDIREDRITAIGKGKSHPVADNATQEGRAQNRRVEIELTL